ACTAIILLRTMTAGLHLRKRIVIRLTREIPARVILHCSHRLANCANTARNMMVPSRITITANHCSGLGAARMAIFMEFSRSTKRLSADDCPTALQQQSTVYAVCLSGVVAPGFFEVKPAPTGPQKDREWMAPRL